MSRPFTCCRFLILTLVAVAVMAPLLTGGPAAAHFNLADKRRVIHVVIGDRAVDVFVRTPLMMATSAAARAGKGDPAAREILIRFRPDLPIPDNLISQRELRHLAPLLAASLSGALHARLNGQPAKPVVQAMRIHSAKAAPPFESLDQARLALTGDLIDAGASLLFVDRAFIDLHLRFATIGNVPVGAFSLADGQGAGLPGEEALTNYLLVHRGKAQQAFSSRGRLMASPLVAPSPLAGIRSFIASGINHILTGIDHVLFVLCLTIGAATMRALLWRVTGFTLGHTVTLIAGFLGFAPSAAWFIPAVETAIALSIIYAGLIALAKKAPDATFPVAAAIGLLHGYGFSFVLTDSLQLDAPNLIASLLSFNLGVEMGQLAIVIPVWLIFRELGRRGAHLRTGARWSVAVPSIAVAAYWSVERFGGLVELALQSST